MFTKRTSVGLDVCRFRFGGGSGNRQVTGDLLQLGLTPAHEHVLSWVLRSLPGAGGGGL